MTEFVLFLQTNLYLLLIDAGIVFVFFLVVLYLLSVIMKQRKILSDYTVIIDEAASKLGEHLEQSEVKKSHIDKIEKEYKTLKDLLGKTIPVSDVIDAMVKQHHDIQNTKLSLLSAIKDHQIQFDKIANDMCFDNKELKDSFSPTISAIPEVKELMEKL